MMFLFPKFSPGWKKIFAAALVLVACEPFNPFGTCGEFDPPCAERAYELSIRDGKRGVYGSGDAVDSTSFSISLGEIWSQPAATFSSGGRGCAYALSCEGCSSYFEADSVYFTTGLVTASGDTLPAGHNFSTHPVPEGIRHFGGGWIEIVSIGGFRDSVFEARFRGTIDGVEKSAAITITIRNAALLIP